MNYWQWRKTVDRAKEGGISEYFPAEAQLVDYCDIMIEMAKNIGAVTTDKNIHALIDNAMGQLDEDKS